MNLRDLQDLSAKLEAQGLEHAYLTYPMPKSRKNPFGKIRTPFGLCEVLSVGNSGRANISVPKKKIDKLIKKLQNEMVDAARRNAENFGTPEVMIKTNVSIQTDPDTGEHYLDLKEVLAGTGVKPEDVHGYVLHPRDDIDGFALELFDAEGKRINFGIKKTSTSHQKSD